MKKIVSILAILVIAMFVLSGCGSKEISAPEEVKTVSHPSPTDDVKTAPQPEPEPQPAEQYNSAPEPEPETAPVKEPSKKVKDLLSKHSRVKSLHYMYQDPLNYPAEWPTWIKDNKMHIDLRTLDQVNSDTYVNQVYLDKASKTAVGYCESNEFKCKDPNQAVKVKFAKYNRKSPIDWIEGVTYAEIETTETMQQRTVVRLAYTDDKGAKVVMWVDDYYGVPVKVEVTKDGDKKRYVFEDLAFNNVEDSDLKHQTIAERYNVVQ